METKDREIYEIRERLFALRDEKNAAFAAKLIPNIPAETILGARTPALRKLAKELTREGKGSRFMEALPHAYFEENGLHSFLLDGIRDYDGGKEKQVFSGKNTPDCLFIWNSDYPPGICFLCLYEVTLQYLSGD